MAFKNRDEVSISIQALTAVVGETEHKESLDDNFAQSVVFRKDVKTTDTAPGTTKTIDFTDIDYIAVTQSAAVSTTYTINGVQQGELKYLKISKDSGETIAFDNIDDQTTDATIFDDETEVLYLIINKDGTNILAIPISQSIFKASTAEIQAYTIDNKFITPLGLNDVMDGYTIDTLDIGDWNMDVTQTVNVAHGLSSAQWKTMKILQVTIRNDADDNYTPLDSVDPTDTPATQGGVIGYGSTSIQLTRVTGGKFDDADYNSTSYNRGTVLIAYEV